MSGQLTSDDKVNEYGSVHAYGQETRCYRESEAVVCRTLNGTAKEYFRDNKPIYAPAGKDYWSICRIDARGAECWHELHGV